MKKERHYLYAVLGQPPQVINVLTVQAYAERHCVPCDYSGDLHFTPQQLSEMAALDRAAGNPLPPAHIVAEALLANAKLFAWVVEASDH
jgi:hypothetical protein